VKKIKKRTNSTLVDRWRDDKVQKLHHKLKLDLAK